MKTLYCILGGSDENMKLRADLTMHNLEDDELVFLTGFPSEVEYMATAIYIHCKNPIKRVKAWDTLTNFTQDLFPYLKANPRIKKVVICTGTSQGSRVDKIWKLYAKKFNVELELHNTYEFESKMEHIAFWFYKCGWLGIRASCIIARILRLLKK